MTTTPPPRADELADFDATPRPSRRLVASIASFVIVFSVAGYAWRGNFEGLRATPGAQAASEAGGVSAEQIEALVARLVERMQGSPDDAEGWAMLGRTYSLLGRPAEALQAFRKVAALRPKDAQALADLADAIAVQNGRKLEGEPETLILQAVQLDPRNVKALTLAGSAAFNRADHKAAADYWQRAIDAAEPNSGLREQLQGALDKARQHTGQPAVGGTSAADGASGTVLGARVSGRVTLAPALRERAAPDDTLFVFARQAQGGGMPVAILRKKVQDLPLDFSLDDSMAMNSAARLSSTSHVIVGARVSRSGKAMPQPGDLQGLSQPVALGASSVAVQISEIVR